MLLPRPVHVEIAKARHLRRTFGKHAPHIAVEQALRVAVHVERRFVRAILGENAARAVDRRARCIQERDVVVLAMIEQRHRVPVVVAHHEAAIGLHRVRARTLVQHRGDVVLEVACADARDEFVLVEVIRDIAVREIAELVGIPQVVDGDDVALAARVERPDQVRPDESGGAGDDDVHVRCSVCYRARTPRGRDRCCPARWSRTAPVARRRTATHSRRSPPRQRHRRPAGPPPTAPRDCRRAPRGHR